MRNFILIAMLASLIAPISTQAAPKPKPAVAHAAQAKPLSVSYCYHKLRGEATDGNGANDNDVGRVWAAIENGGDPNYKRVGNYLDYSYLYEHIFSNPLQLFMNIMYVTKGGTHISVWFECWRHGFVPTGQYDDNWYGWGKVG